MPEPSCVCDLHHSSQQSQILNSLIEARDQTCHPMVPSLLHFSCAMTGTPRHAYFKMCVRLPVLIQAAITKYHRLESLNNKHLFLTFLEAGKSKIKVLADSFLSKTSYWLVNGHLLTGASHGREEKPSHVPFSVYKDLSSVMRT